MYELYNKDKKVAEIGEEDCFVRVIEPDLLPFTLRNKSNAKWFFKGRIQQMDRKYAADIFRLTGQNSLEQMIKKTALASLNDTFWLKIDSDDISWSDVNLYDEKNEFDQSVFKAALTGLTEEDYTSYVKRYDLRPITTPELTTGGSYAKAWYRNDEYGLCLLKCGKRQYNNREVVAEFLSSLISSQLCDVSVSYHLKNYNGEVYCASEIFTDEDHGFVSFMDYQYYSGNQQKMTESNIDYIRRIVSQFDDDQKVNEMLVADVLTLNMDRHYGNFGFLYNTDTMEIESFAPVFDFNQSLGFDVSDDMVEGYSLKPENYVSYRLKMKAGGDCRQIINACLTDEVVSKLKDCNLVIPSDVDFPFWDDKRNKMAEAMFDYQMRQLEARHKLLH